MTTQSSKHWRKGFIVNCREQQVKISDHHWRTLARMPVQEISVIIFVVPPSSRAVQQSHYCSNID